MYQFNETIRLLSAMYAQARAYTINTAKAAAIGLIFCQTKLYARVNGIIT
jgi:hypothetical protein